MSEPKTDSAEPSGHAADVKRRAGVAAVTLLGLLLAGLGMSRLEFAGLEGMMGQDDPGEQRYREYAQRFDASNEAIVLIDTGQNGEREDQAWAAADALGRALSDEPAVGTTVWRIDPAGVSPKLLLTLSREEVASELDKLRQLRPLLESQTPTALLDAGFAEGLRVAGGGLASGAGTQGRAEGFEVEEATRVFVVLMDAWAERMRTPAGTPMDLFGRLQAASLGDAAIPLRSSSGRLFIVRATLLEGVGDKPGLDGSLAALRRHVEAVRARFTGVELGVTGFAAVQSEAEAATRSAVLRGGAAAAAAVLVMGGLLWRRVGLSIAAGGAALGVMGWVVGVAGFVGVAAGPLVWVAWAAVG
ncbi:MAG: hypothetical protein AAFX76_11375, partial [Planctomycetota bacterium]